VDSIKRIRLGGEHAQNAATPFLPAGMVTFTNDAALDLCDELGHRLLGHAGALNQFVRRIRTVLCNVATPLMNAIAERWIGGCRRELLDRTLGWNQNHLRRILHEYETHHNQHRPHRSLNAAAPLKPLPEPVDLERYRVRRRTRASGTINEYRLAG